MSAAAAQGDTFGGPGGAFGGAVGGGGEGAATAGPGLALGGALPPLRGTLRLAVPMAPLAWMRAGGPAAAMAHPADLDDLAAFVAALDPSVPVLPMGVASNLLVRDGGFEGVVVRFGGPLAEVRVEGDAVVAGAGALDARVAQVAAKAGLSGLEFLSGIPGTVGGAVRMNAGAFGGETADRLLWAELVDRGGGRHVLAPEELGLGYRRSAVPEGWCVARAAFKGVPGDPEGIAGRLAAIRDERERAQPLRVATGGSTFKNPPGGDGAPKAWELIDRAGCRGLRFGHAAVSEKHCNFLINTGRAGAAELEALGEEVRARVLVTSGVRLEWEIVRVGTPMGVELAA